jgi:hypothetical protein
MAGPDAVNPAFGARQENLFDLGSTFWGMP